MKNSILVAFLFISISFVSAQPTFSISAGVKMIKPDSRISTLYYVDESPSRDNLYKEIEQKGNMSIMVNGRFNTIKESKSWNSFIELQGYLGSINGGALNIGFFRGGKKASKIKLQPEIGGVLGYSFKSLGEIENNDLYIKVNNTQFQDNTNVKASLQNLYLGIKPGFSLGFAIDNGREIGFGVNYVISYKVGSIGFRGTDENGQYAKAKEDLTETNVGFYVAGQKTSTIPYNPDGLEFKLFYSF